MAHTLDLKRLGEVFEHLLKQTRLTTWEYSFVRAMQGTWKSRGSDALTQDSLCRLERIYVRY